MGKRSVSLLLAMLAVFCVCGTGAAEGAAEEELAPGYGQCMDKAQTTSDYVECADEAFCYWDAILNENYQRIMKQCPYDTDEACAAYVGKLREAERAWLRYRDATAGFLSQKLGGTYDRVEASLFAAEATRAQALLLAAPE